MKIANIILCQNVSDKKENFANFAHNLSKNIFGTLFVIRITCYLCDKFEKYINRINFKKELS